MKKIILHIGMHKTGTSSIQHALQGMEDENFKKCWALSNLRPLNSKQNLLEGNRG